MLQRMLPQLPPPFLQLQSTPLPPLLVLLPLQRQAALHASRRLVHKG
jgi:hypothetical protein